jgi:GTPase SAR1 family protein
MAKVIILEGPDGGGKTSLAKKLMAEGFQYRHEGPPPIGVDLISYYLKILDDSLKSPMNVVHDRLWLGERVYGPISRGSDRIGPQGYKLFERLHRSKPISQYICTPKIGVARINYQKKILEDDDYLKSVDKWEKVFKAYTDLQYSRNGMGEVFDYTENTHIQIIKDAMSFERNRKNLPEGTIGSPTAKYLFIGDRPNHISVDVPFFSTVGYSGYFNRALELANIHEDDLALSNVYDPLYSTHDLSKILKSLPKLEFIIPMGDKAQEWLVDAYIPDIKIKGISHPSYLKRFKSRNPQVMADIIKEALNAR